MLQYGHIYGEKMNKVAKKLLKTELLKHDLSYVELARLMQQKGYKETADTIRSKINRGSYNIVFLLHICDTLDIELALEDKTINLK